MDSRTISTARISLYFLAVFLSVCLAQAQTTQNAKAKIYAQRLVEDVSAAHPEITGLELATTPPKETHCVTIAATEAKEIGEKCDKDELTAMKTNKPFVEKEKENGQEVYDVTLPLHDSAGNVIGTVGMDFKSNPDQQEAKIRKIAQRIAKEVEAQIPAKRKLFEPAA